MKKILFILVIVFVAAVGTLIFFTFKEKVNIANDNVFIPKNCVGWYDGCNYCSTKNGNLLGCTLMACTVGNQPNAHCTRFEYQNKEYGLSFKYSDKWKICPSDIEKFGVHIARQELNCHSLGIEQTPKTMDGQAAPKYDIYSLNIKRIGVFQLGAGKGLIRCSDYTQCFKLLKQDLYKATNSDFGVVDAQEITIHNTPAISYNWYSPIGFGGTSIIIKDGTTYVGALVDFTQTSNHSTKEIDEIYEILSTIEFTE